MRHCQKVWVLGQVCRKNKSTKLRISYREKCSFCDAQNYSNQDYNRKVHCGKHHHQTVKDNMFSFGAVDLARTAAQGQGKNLSTKVIGEGFIAVNLFTRLCAQNVILIVIFTTSKNMLHSLTFMLLSSVCPRNMK